MTQLTLKWARKGIYPFDFEASCYGRASIPSMFGGVRLELFTILFKAEV